MILFNKSKNILLADDLIIADTFLKRFWGLMFKKSFNTGKALLIRPCNSIHMFFMKFPIDVIFLNKNNEIIKVYKNLKPWRITSIIKSAVCVIELNSGILESSNTQVSDILEFN